MIPRQCIQPEGSASRFCCSCRAPQAFSMPRRIGLVGQNLAAPLILAGLLAMTVGVGVASSSHRSLVINTAVAAAMVIVAHMAFATLARG